MTTRLLSAIEGLTGPPARSVLFVPGDRRDRFEKGFTSGTHAVLLDLEDAVAPADKSSARDAVSDFLQGHLAPRGPQRLVRINAVDTAWYAQDLAMVADLPPEVGVLLPKAEPQALAALGAALTGRALYALVETVVAMQNLSQLCASPGLVRVAFGSIDFGIDAGIEPGDDEIELAAVRTALVLASRSALLLPPLDGVGSELQDEARMVQGAQRSRRFGFGGKLCIHPRQVRAVNAAFSVSEADLRWALGVISAFEASQGAATRYEGRMVDLPVVLKARRILAAHENND